jgi:hypothetical protein
MPHNSQSQSHIATDGRSVSLVRLGVEPHQIFIPVRKLLSCLYGAPSLTRGRVCHLPGSVRSYVICLYLHYIQVKLMK